jgi:hypothetical protein
MLRGNSDAAPKIRFSSLHPDPLPASATSRSSIAASASKSLLEA